MSTLREPNRRARQRQQLASLDTTCPECRGTLNIQNTQVGTHRGRDVLMQDAACLHCNVAYTRLIPIPQPNPLWTHLTNAASLAFTSAKVQATRAAQAIRALTR